MYSALSTWYLKCITICSNAIVAWSTQPIGAKLAFVNSAVETIVIFLVVLLVLDVALALARSLSRFFLDDEFRLLLGALTRHVSVAQAKNIGMVVLLYLGLTLVTASILNPFVVLINSFCLMFVVGYSLYLRATLTLKYFSIAHLRVVGEIKLEHEVTEDADT